MWIDFIDYVSSAANWFGDQGILARVLEHLWYSVLAVGIGALIAVPSGMIIGHTGRGETVIVSIANVLRALPSLGLMILLVLLIGLGLLPPIVALVLLAVPPLLAGVYSGISNVDRDAVDAARAMGMTEMQVLLKVEMPNALPLIVGGLRGATLQVVSTATIAAYVNLGGLGRYIFDGLAQFAYGEVLVGAVLVALLALLLDGLLAWLMWAVQPGSGHLRTASTGPISGIVRQRSDRRDMENATYSAVNTDERV